MSSRKRVGLSFLLVLSWMWIYRLPDGSALAEVKDETGMFSQSARQEADGATRQIKQKYGKEMLVEVFPEIPAELRSQYSPDRKDQFFAEWMTRRAQELKVNGVYVLICRNPNHLQVDAGRETRQRAFTAQNVEQLKNVLVTRFRNKQYDDGLKEAVSYVDRTLAANLGSNAAAGTANPQYNYQAPNSSSGTPARPPTGSGISWIWWVLLIGIAIFILSRFLRSRAPGSSTYAQRYGGGGNYPAGGYPQGGYPPQSGGFGKGIMGGLLGGMAGGWLQDKFAHRNQGSGYAPPPPTSSGFSEPSAGDDAGQGFSGGSGGDFGGGGGGSDFGGGGGDSGGGGGDSGGGGGGSGGDF